MEYSIRQLADMTGVSTRTLRYYDEIGLLKPLFKTDAGYRHYGPKEVELLQQILFYRERGLGLDEIQAIVSGEEFDVMAALTDHLSELKKQQDRIAGLITTVKKTIASMKGEIKMDDREKFESFKEKLVSDNEAAYGQEIRKKYGEDEVDASNRKLLKMTEEEYKEFQNLERQIKKELEEAVRNGVQPESETGKEIAGLHRRWIEKTWSSYSAEAHKGLVLMYTADERFLKYYDDSVSGCAAFLQKAVETWM